MPYCTDINRSDATLRHNYRVSVVSSNYTCLYLRGGFNTITHSLITDHCNGIALLVTGKVKLR